MTGPETSADAQAQRVHVLDALTPTQATALEAYLAGASIKGAAKEAGVNEKTVRRWLANSETFKAALLLLRRQRWGVFMDKMAKVADLAAERLAELLEKDTAVEPRDRVAAARAVFAGYRDAHAASLTQDRLDQLEADLKGKAPAEDWQ